MNKKPTYKELEQRLKDLEQTTFKHNRLLNILNAIPDGVYIVSQQNDIEYINPVIEQEFGPVGNRKCYEYFHDRTEVCPWCKNAEVHAGKSVHWEWYSSKNGRYYDLFDTSIKNTDGSISKFEIFHDITTLKQAEEALRESKERLYQVHKMEAIGTLAGGIAHDFNNILAAIFGYTEMARDNCQPGSTVARDLSKVLEAGNRAKDLVQQILAFSRQDKTKSIPLQPANIVNEAIKMLRPTIPTTIEISHNIAYTTGCIFADPTQIHQILINLCTNAFHAMEETGGKLDISLKEVTLSNEDLVHEPNVEGGAFIQVSICDSGHGIAPAIKDKIFDPYFTTKETGKGTGMGLSIVHGIAKSYGGFISLYSELGEGTAFHRR